MMLVPLQEVRINFGKHLELYLPLASFARKWSTLETVLSLLSGKSE